MDQQVTVIPEFGVCRQCGRKFIPNWYEKAAKFTIVCGTCALGNLEKFLAEP